MTDATQQGQGQSAAPGRPGGTRVGEVAELWRYPVKSMQGERMASLELTAGGFVGDRRYGLVAADGQHLLSAKAVPELFEACARTDDGAVIITMPDGTDVAAADPDVSALLSRWLGRQVELRSVDAQSGSLAYEMTFDPPDDSAELFEIPAPVGTFLDLAAVHVLSTASLDAIAAAHPDGVTDVRRFRPNVLVGTGAATGFAEDAWVGSNLGFGDGGAAIRVDQATVRCAMPLRAQPALGDSPALPRDLELYKVLDGEHLNHLGIYCGVASTGAIRVGDPVLLH